MALDWVYLTTAPDQVTAEMWAELLSNEGVEARISPEDAVSFLGVSSRPCRLLVSVADLPRAREILRGSGLPPGE